MLTQEQIDQARENIGMPSPDISSPAANVARRHILASQYDEEQKKPQSKFGETMEDISQLGSNIAGRFRQESQKVEDIKTSEDSFLSKQIQKVGAGAGFLSGSIGDIFTGIVKGALSQEDEDAVKTKVADISSSVIQNPLVKPVIKEYVTAYQESTPETQRNLEGIFNIGMLALDATGAVGIKKGAQVFVKSGAKKTAVETTGAIGKALISPVTKTGSYVKSRLPKLLGIFSGESDDVIRAALRNPKLADIGIAQGDVALRKAIKEGAENSVKIRSSFIKGFSQAKQKIMGEYTKVLIPKNQVVSKFKNLLKENKVIINKNGTLDFTVSKIKANPGEITKIKDAYAALNKWDSFTIDSLDEYKQLVGQFTRFASESGVPSKSPFLGKLHHSLNEIAYEKLPKDIAAKYKNLNKKFGDNIEMYDDIQHAFNSGDPYTRLANSLGKNKDTLRQLLEFYEKKSGKDILPIVAGRELAMEKNAAFGFLNPRSWVDFFISPGAQGKVITTVGKVVPSLK